MVASFGPTKEITGVPQASSSKQVTRTLEEAITEYEESRIITSEEDILGGERARRRLLQWVEMDKYRREHRCKQTIPFKALMWAFALGVVMGISMMLYYSPTTVTHGLPFPTHTGLARRAIPIFESEYGPSTTIYPMQKGPSRLHMILGKKCVPINVQSESDNRELVDLHHSLAHHIQADNLASLSSYRVGQPHCYIVLRTSDGGIVPMGNPSIVQVNWESVVSAHVPSSYCPERDPNHKVTRSFQVWVSYLDPTNNWQRMERRLDRKDAWAFQVEFAILHGLSVCDGSDKGVESLKQLLRAN